MKPGARRLPIGLLLAGFGLASLTILPIPFTRDQGIYAYNGWRWMAGDVPYLSFFGHKGPLLYFIYAVSLKFSGGAMWGPNLADAMARTVTVVLAYLIGKSLFPRERDAFLAAFFTALPLFGVFNSCWWNAQAETFALPLIAGAAWMASIKGGRAPRSRSFLSGLFLGLAIMLKPTAAVFGAALPFWLEWNHSPGPSQANESRVKGWTKATAVFSLGLLLGTAPWIVYLWERGALGSFYELLFEFNSVHLRSALSETGGHSASLFGRGLKNVFFLTPVLVLAGLLPAENGNESKPRAFVFSFLLVSVLGVVIQARFFLYHWLTVVPFMGLAAAMGLARLHDKTGTRAGRRAAFVMSAVILTWLSLTYARGFLLIHDSYLTFDYLRGKIGLAQYYARFSEADAKGKGDFNLFASAAAADYLRNHSPQGSRALVFGYEPLVNYLAARPAPTRFQIDYPLTFTPRSEKAAGVRDRFRRQFLKQLRDKPPLYVVMVDDDVNAIEPEPSSAQALEFAEFHDWLSRNYSKEAAIEDFTFYKRK